MRNRAVIVGIGALALAAVVATLTLVYRANWKLEWNWFYLWTLGPYLILSMVLLAVGGRTRATQLASLMSALLVLIFASVMYVGAMFDDASYGLALALTYGPFALLSGGVLVFMVTFLIARVFGAGK